MELVVAEQKACALVSYQEDMAEKVRVLLKTEKKIRMPVFFVCSGDAYTVDGNKRKKDTVTDAEKLLKGKKQGKEIKFLRIPVAFCIDVIKTETRMVPGTREI